MKPLLLLLLPFILASCAEYQYLTVSGISINKNQEHEFVYGNDTLQLLYHFKPDSKMLVTVANRTNEPLIVDWWKSAMIIGGNVFGFYNPDASISGRVDTVDRYLYYARMSGTVHMNQTSQFVPSHSRISRELTVFSIDSLRNLPEHEAIKDTIRISDAEFYKYRKMFFEKERSPLLLKTYLTFRIGRANEEKEFSVEHQFYVSEVWKINTDFRNLPERITSRGDMIFLSH